MTVWMVYLASADCLPDGEPEFFEDFGHAVERFGEIGAEVWKDEPEYHWPTVDKINPTTTTAMPFPGEHSLYAVYLCPLRGAKLKGVIC